MFINGKVRSREFTLLEALLNGKKKMGAHVRRWNMTFCFELLRSSALLQFCLVEIIF